MKKPLKYGLITGITVLLIAGAWVYSGYGSGRMPTLPAPPGVVVPAGMRYVGGDEFNQPDGSAPDAGRWTRLNRKPNPVGVSISNGCLVIASHSIGGIAAFSPSPTAERHTRVDFRLRMPGTEIAKAFLRSAGGGQNRWHFAYVGLYGKTNSTLWSLVNVAAPGGKLTEEVAGNNLTRPIDYDGNFHDYSIEWNGRDITCTRDTEKFEASSFVKQQMTGFWVSPEWRKRLRFLPEEIRIKIFAFRTWAFTGPQTIAFGCSDPLDTPERPLRLEIDYVRIFQE